MEILVVGGGGREHTLVWKIAQSPLVEKIYCAPGNGGIAKIAECVPIKAMDIEGIVKFSKENGIDMVVVAPDDPLAAGMVDELEKEGIRAFGPTKKAAIIEWSKSFAKDLLHSIIAASLLGPNALIPSFSSSSTIPAARGSSGVTTTRSILFSFENALIPSISVALMEMHCAMEDIPPFPGAQ